MATCKIDKIVYYNSKAAMKSPLEYALTQAFNCINKTIEHYLNKNFNLSVETEVHNLINENLKKLGTSYKFTAQTIFDYDTEEFVVTLDVKSSGGGTVIKKPIRYVPRPESTQFNYLT